LRWLSGGSCLDIRLSAGISLAKFYSCVYKCIDAVLEAEDLAYKFPGTEKEFNEAAQGFESLSTQAAIKGYVACLDGHLLQIKVPGLFKLGLQHLVEQMTLQHLKKLSQMIQKLLQEDLSLVTMLMFALRLY